MSNYIYGLQSVLLLLEKNPERIKELHLLNQRQDQKIKDILQKANKNHIKVIFNAKEELDHLAQNGNHQGAVARCESSKQLSEKDLERLLEDLNHPAFLLILDNVQDPHNLGACLRTANAAGVDAIIAPKDKSVGITATVSKVASGAAEIVPFIQVTNLARTMEFLKEQGVWIYGASHLGNKTVYEADFRGKIALVMGSEGTGMRRLTEEKCDVVYRIPMKGEVSSLNVSVAAGIFMFEAVRQRLI